MPPASPRRARPAAASNQSPPVRPAAPVAPAAKLYPKPRPRAPAPFSFVPAALPEIPAAWDLLPRRNPPHPVDGFRLASHDPAVWLAHLSTQPPALQALAHFLPLPDGVLIAFPSGIAQPRRSSPRLRPFHRLLTQDARELWIPCDADLAPALDPTALAAALFQGDDRILVADLSSPAAPASVPVSGEAGIAEGNRLQWLPLRPAAALRPAQLLQLANSGAPANRPDLNRPPELLTHPMLAIRRSIQHSSEELLERGREDIATSLEQVPDETRGWLAKLLDQLILGDRPDPLAPQPDPAGPPRTHGFGDKLLQILRAGGDIPPPGLGAAHDPAADPQGKHWLRAGLYSLMNLFSRKPPPASGNPGGPGAAGPMDAEAIRNFSLRQKLLEWWLQRSPRARSELYGEQRNAIVQLLDEFEKGAIQEALRHALPLSPIHDPKATRTVGIYDSARLPENDLNAPLSIDHTRRPAVAWVGGADLLEELRKNYTHAALQLVRQKRHRKAAYIYAMLLGDFWQAAHVLAQGGHHREAAQIYLEQLGDLRWAAAEFEAGGDLAQAAEIYLKIDDYDRAARVVENAGLVENARQIYRQQADRLLEQANFLAAGHVHAYKLHAVDNAIATFEAGLRQSSGSIASELAVAALRCQLEQGRWADAGTLEERLYRAWIDDLANLTSVQALMHFCGELAILGKDLRDDGPPGALKQTWRDHVLIAAARLAKIHQEAGRPGYMSRVLEPLHRFFLDDPACFSDAQRAQAMRQKLRAPLRTRENSARDLVIRDFARVAGHVPITCAAIASESGILVCGDTEGAVWLYDPASQKLLQRQGIGAPVVAVAIEAGGYYTAVLDAQKHLRIFQTGAGFSELSTVSAFSVAGAACMAPQIVRDRIFVGTKFGSIVSYRLVDGLTTGEPFVLSDQSFSHLWMLADPNRLLAVTDSGRFTVLSYYDNRLAPLDAWQDQPAQADSDKKIRQVTGANATGDVFLQISGSGQLLRYNAELRSEPAWLDLPGPAPVGAFGCLGDGTLVAALHGTLFRLSIRPDEPHRTLPIDLTGLDPRWILPHPQTDRFWLVDTAGNARLAALPRPAADNTKPARATTR